jgi:hypothetical protein
VTAYERCEKKRICHKATLKSTRACCAATSHVSKTGIRFPQWLEKMARALEVPMYKLFYDGEAPPKLENLAKRKTPDDIAWGSSGKEARFLTMFRRILGRIGEKDRKLLLAFAQKVAAKRAGRKSIAA